MSLYALLRNNENPTKHDVEEAFDGNLCRCTGYRPILDAAQTFSVSKACGNSTSNGGAEVLHGEWEWFQRRLLARTATRAA